jgi:hypothetical protein
MTIEATFVKQLDDTTTIYRVTLNDPAHQGEKLEGVIQQETEEYPISGSLTSRHH